MRRAFPVGRLAVAAIAAALTATPARAQDEDPELRVDAATIDIGGRMQAQLNTTSVDGESPSEVIMRRARLEVEVEVNPLVSGRLQAEVSGSRPTYRDAYLQLNFSPGFVVRGGHMYIPFSLLQNTSSVRTLPIERGLAIRGVDGFDQFAAVSDLDYGDRDLGLQILGAPAGAPLGLTYQIGAFSGPLQGEVGGQDSWLYSARVSVSPAEQLRLGAAWSSRDFAPDVAFGTPDLQRGNAFEVDLEYGAFAPGPHVLAEASFGEFDPITERGFFGAHAWLGYRTQPVGVFSTVEPIFRVSHGDVEDLPGGVQIGGTLLTPGINLYFGGWNRLMVNYDFWMAAGEGGNEGSFKTQFQLVF